MERNRENVGLIHRNVAALRYEGRATVRHADAYRFARTLRPLDDRPIVVFLDPPYREYEVNARLLRHMISGLIDQLPAGSAIALESGRALDAQILPDFDSWDIRRYGSTQVAIRVSAETPAQAAADQVGVTSEGDEVPATGNSAAALRRDETDDHSEPRDDADDPL